MVADDVFRDQPVLLGARVRLEPLGGRHFDGLWPMFGEPEGSRLTGTHATFTEAQIRGWLATRRDHHDRADWAIVRVADGAVLGEAVINDSTRPTRPRTSGSRSSARRSRACTATRHDAISMAILATDPRPTGSGR